MDLLQINQYLLQHGIKPSMQRIAIMEYLLQHLNHPTVDDIYSSLSKTIPTISRTTIYNTLKLFSENAACQVLYIDDKNVRYDGNTSFHAHFRCKKCNRIYDVPSPNDFLSLSVDNSTEHFSITETQIYHLGYCKECQNKEKE